MNTSPFDNLPTPSSDRREDEDPPQCGEACDHCRPEILHHCILKRGHRGYHTGHNDEDFPW